MLCNVIGIGLEVSKVGGSNQLEECSGYTRARYTISDFPSGDFCDDATQERSRDFQKGQRPEYVTCRVFQKELYKFERVYQLHKGHIQRFELS
jgi:hypothetical protein